MCENRNFVRPPINGVLVILLPAPGLSFLGTFELPFPLLKLSCGWHSFGGPKNGKGIPVIVSVLGPVISQLLCAGCLFL